jgi:hypothetical protein
LLWANAHTLNSSKSETAEILRSIDFFLIGYLKDEGREHPTGGLVDEPSSEAVEEAGHFEEIVLREKAVGKKSYFLKIPSVARKPYSDEKLQAANMIKPAKSN